MQNLLEKQENHILLKKIYEMANAPKYSYFTKYDNHMMDYDENLVSALKSFLKSVN